MGDPTSLKFDIIPASRQTVWKWSAAANFILGGAGSALYLFDSLLVSVRPTVFSPTDLTLEIIAIALVAMGFLSVSIEAGRPLRAGYALRRWASNWMSREMVVGVLFLAAALLDLFLSVSLLRLSAVLLASTIIASQSFLVYSARSVPAWHTRLMLPMSVTSSLHCGYGVFLIFSPVKAIGVGIVLWIGVLLNIANLAVLLSYQKKAEKIGLGQGLKYFERGDSWIAMALICHICSLFLLSVCVVTANFATGISHVLTIMAGLSMIAGSATQKAWAILRAGYEAEVWIQIGNRPVN